MNVNLNKNGSRITLASNSFTYETIYLLYFSSSEQLNDKNSARNKRLEEVTKRLHKLHGL